ncbi:ATP-binding protein [Providencia rettgeri]
MGKIQISRVETGLFTLNKTLESFDFSVRREGEHNVARELAFVERCKNVIVLRSSGVGKTHLAVVLIVKVTDTGYRVIFMPLDKLAGYR